MSVVVNVTVVVPLALAGTVNVAVQMPPEPVIAIEASDAFVCPIATAAQFGASAMSTSAMAKATVGAGLASSSTVRSAMFVIVGASFTGATFIVNVKLAVSAPSLTVTVIV